jgi:Transposase DDE domain
MKATLAGLATVLQQLFFQSAEAAATKAKLIKKKRKLNAAAFAQGLTFCWMQHPNATTAQLTSFLGLAGSPMSEPGLCQRFTPAAADFFLALLQQALQHAFAAPPAAVALLARFNGVYLLDSTQLTLPPVLAELWSSTGGVLCPAGMKVLATVELLGGALSFQLGPGRQGDLAFDSSRRELPKGALRLADLGFFDLDLLRGYQINGVFWISRAMPQTMVQFADGRRMPVWQYLSACREGGVDKSVVVGEELSCRLLAWRCPQEVASRRLQRAWDDAQKHGKGLSQQQRVMCQWTVLLCNVPAERLTADEAWIVYRVRWQVELLFKRWKSLGGLGQSRGEKPCRVLVEVYAKLLGALLNNWLQVAAGGCSMRRSAWKSFHLTQSWGMSLLMAVGHFMELVRLLGVMGEALRRIAKVDKRKKKAGTLQTLEQPQGNGPRQGPPGSNDAPMPPRRPRGRPRRGAPSNIGDNTRAAVLSS